MQQAITGFHLDDEGYWVADLACGHGQHVRHRPPFVERPWVQSAATRRAKLGTLLVCKLCEGGGTDADSDVASGAGRLRP